MTPSEIRTLRQRLRLTQQALADRIGVHVETVRRWEQGRTCPSRMALRFLRVLERS